MIMEAVEAAVLYEALEASARTKQDPAKPPEPNNGQQTEGSVASATTANTQGWVIVALSSRSLSLYLSLSLTPRTHTQA